ncbi:clotting factor B [Trichonephila clavipes]|nr:clotting factor B [Trichonephila clavipes]
MSVDDILQFLHLCRMLCYMVQDDFFQCRTVLDLPLPLVLPINKPSSHFFDVIAETFCGVACVYSESISDTAIMLLCRILYQHRPLNNAWRNRLKLLEMTECDWFGKGIFSWSCILLYLVNEGIDGRRYKCSTSDGRDGVCVAERYCREAFNQSLVPCEGGESYCCPIPTTHRSAESSPAHRTTEPPSRTSINNNRPQNESPYGKDQPRTQYDDERSRNHSNSNGWPSESPRPKEDGRNPSRPSYDDGYPRKPVSTHNRPNVQPKDERDTSTGRPMQDGGGKVRFEGDSRVHEDRPVKPSVHNKPSGYIPDDRIDYPKRRPQYESGSGRETVSSNRPRPKENEERRRPEPSTPNRYPSVDEIEKNHKPSRTGPNGRPNENPKTPVEFPRPQDFPVAQPQVPSCGGKPYELFIAGGEASEPHEWPWMTAIFRRHQNSRPKLFLCGGSLINTKYVLTAAHCFINNYVTLPASAFVVRLGSHMLSSGEEYTVSNLVIHHNHSGGDFFNDIALVRLASEVYITDKIAPICLPFPDMMYENFVGRVATVAGWGDTVFRTGGARVLQHVSVPIVSSEECFAAYSRVQGAAFLARGSDHVICAGLREGGKDACLGDSGGPLMLKSSEDRWIIVGIVSLGYKCAEPGYPGVYTRVTHYMSWIRDNMKPY